MEARKFHIAMASPELLEQVAQHARQADVDELWASAKMTPIEALTSGHKWSTTFVLLVEDTAVCAFGVVPISALSGIGAPWMVGTTLLDSCAVPFIRHCRTDLKAFFAQWSRLYNVVDARNMKAIRWLKWLGFEVLPATPYGPFGLPFHPFIMEVHHV